jgi:hypothetical protein
MHETKLTDAKPSGWMKDWTPEELAELYNGGDGRPYEDAKPSGEKCEYCGGSGKYTNTSHGVGIKGSLTWRCLWLPCNHCHGTGRNERREVKR